VEYLTNLIYISDMLQLYSQHNISYGT